MKQNKYDELPFFERYSAMSRSVDGLDAAGEWHVLRAMLPALSGRRVLDLGCGFGWHCRYALEQGAASVVGVDLSERMLARAMSINADPAIRYERMAIEDIDFPDGSFDVVLSSLAFHYVRDLRVVFDKVFRCLVPGGDFVFSIEHPVFTARAAQDWHYGPDGEILHWPLDDYQDEGERHSTWMSDDIVKYHRTFSTLLNTLPGAGFMIREINEPKPHPDMLASMTDELRRPMFLLVSAQRA